MTRYLSEIAEAFPDLRYEVEEFHEAGKVAIDEGHVIGTHSGSLPTSTGEAIPPTGRQVRLRSCDLATVENGRIG